MLVDHAVQLAVVPLFIILYQVLVVERQHVLQLRRIIQLFTKKRLHDIRFWNFFESFETLFPVVHEGEEIVSVQLYTQQIFKSQSNLIFDVGHEMVVDHPCNLSSSKHVVLVVGLLFNQLNSSFELALHDLR